MDDKREKFERLAEKRVSDAIKKMRLIGNLANKHNYDYTDDHIKQITETLDNELKVLKSRFREANASADFGFAFKTKEY